MNRTMIAIAAVLMVSATAAQAGGLLPRLQPAVARVTALAAPAALTGISGPLQLAEAEPRIGLPALPDLALPELPYVEIPGIPSDQLYWVGHWLDDTVNYYPRQLNNWSTGQAAPAAWDELDIVLGMAAAGDLGGASNRMASIGTKIPAPPQPQLPWELGLTPTYNLAWDATVGTVFPNAYAD